MKYTTLNRCKSGLSHLFTNPTKNMSTENQSLAQALRAPEIEFEMATTSGSLMLAGGAAFAHIQRVAKLFSASDLIPEQFRGNTANCTIALEMAHRMGANPMAVMQNLYIVHGRPGWSSQFIIACLNQCGKFSPLRFQMSGEGEGKECIAWAVEKETGERLEGPAASIAMAKAEGWMGKNGSKWKTMPDLMLRYRAATFFGRLYAPDLLMGMQAVEELKDVEAPRKVRGREVQPAEVPLLFSGAAAVPAVEVRSDSPANVAAAPRELTEEFWSRCDRKGFDFATVCFLLNRADFLGIQEPEDMTADEASRALHSWDKLVELYGKEAA